MPDPARTAALIRRRCPLRPRLAFVLGSGFSGVLRDLTDPHEIPYGKLPGFPSPGVEGHVGKLLIGTINDLPILILEGRGHYYEGHDMERITFPIRTLKALGIKDLVLTNAAGSLRPRMKPGHFMVLSDHINFMGANPLRGTAAAERFVDLTKTYDPELRRQLLKSARTADLKVHSGVYLAVSGPSYETPAEIKAFARLGADAVGMSTVPEAIVARQSLLRVAAISCLTNMAAGLARSGISHEEVLRTGDSTRAAASNWLHAFIRLQSN